MRNQLVFVLRLTQYVRAKLLLEFFFFYLFPLNDFLAHNRPFNTKRYIWELFEMDLHGFRLDILAASFLARLLFIACLTSCIMLLQTTRRDSVYWRAVFLQWMRQILCSVFKGCYEFAVNQPPCHLCVILQKLLLYFFSIESTQFLYTRGICDCKCSSVVKSAPS